MAARDPHVISSHLKPPKCELVPLAPDRAVAMLTYAADSGHSDAAFMLAMIYQHGAGVRRDPEAAGRWLKRAAQLDYDRVLQQLTHRCGDLLQHLLAHCDQLVNGRQNEEGPAREIRRTVEELLDSTRDLEAVAVMRDARHDESVESA